MLDSAVPNLIAKYLDAKVVIQTYNVLIWLLLIRDNLLDQLRWLAVYLGSAFIISNLLPFPI